MAGEDFIRFAATYIYKQILSRAASQLQPCQVAELRAHSVHADAQSPLAQHLARTRRVFSQRRWLLHCFYRIGAGLIFLVLATV